LTRAATLDARSTCFVHEHFPGFRQLDLTFRPVEEPDPELLLELANLLAERRLADVQALGRPPEMQVFRDGDDVAQVPELHEALICRTS
jgi:hypothetical protein